MNMKIMGMMFAATVLVGAAPLMAQEIDRAASASSSDDEEVVEEQGAEENATGGVYRVTCKEALTSPVYEPEQDEVFREVPVRTRITDSTGAVVDIYVAFNDGESPRPIRPEPSDLRWGGTVSQIGICETNSGPRAHFRVGLDSEGIGSMVLPLPDAPMRVELFIGGDVGKVLAEWNGDDVSF